MLPYRQLAERAKKLIHTVQNWPADAPYEYKGILYSEILFMLACCENITPNRIIESGRARGQSTLLLSLAFPDREIVSIEYDAHSPDVIIANARLKDRPLVKLQFGDARTMLPRMIQNGDFVLIDGPKGFRSVRLAIQLLATGKVPFVFVHDLTFKSPERNFIDANFAEARSSDNREFAESAHYIDRSVSSLIPANQQIEGFSGEFGYGFCLTCLPYYPGRAYNWLLFRARMADLFLRLTRPKKIKN